VSWSSTLADYLDELRRLGAEQFLVSYPHPVLVHRLGAAAARQPGDLRFRTDQLRRPALAPVLDGSDADLDLAVHPVRKRPGNPYDDTIMLGRATTNDVVLPYTDLSKLHAYVTRAADGSWLLADAGSTNGTWIGDEQLAANTPAPLGERSALVLGENAFEFLTAGALRALLAAR
jgi:hypothetical protein